MQRTINNFSGFHWLIIGLVVVFLMRAAIAEDYIIIGDDTVAYLSYAKAWLLQDAPPAWWQHGLGALYLLAFTTGLGEYQGAWVAALVASTLLAIPLFLLLRRLTSDMLAVFLAIFVLWTPELAFTLAAMWMYLLSMAVGLTAFYLLIKYKETQNRKYITLGVVAAVSLGFMNISALLIVAPIFVVLFINVYFNDDGGVFLLVAASFLLFIAAGLGFFFDFRSIPWVVAGLALMGVSLVMYRKVDTANPINFLLIIMLPWIAFTSMVIESNNGLLLAPFGRSIAWIYPALALLFAMYAGTPHFTSKNRKFVFGIGTILALIALISWMVFFTMMAEEHSTLTVSSLPTIQQTAYLEGTVGVHPHMLARHVESFSQTDKKVIHTMPADLPLPDKTIANDVAVRCALGIIGSVEGISRIECAAAERLNYLVVQKNKVITIYEMGTE